MVRLFCCSFIEFLFCFEKIYFAKRGDLLFDVAAVGELLIDFTSAGASEDGSPRFDAHAGGAPANYLAAASRFGARAALISRVGDDIFGAMLVDALISAGVDARGVVRDADAFTTLAFVSISPSGEREFSFARRPGADTRIKVEDLDGSIVESAKIFHFGTLSLTDEPARGATFEAIERARRRGAVISCDPNYRAPLWKSEKTAREMIVRAVKLADVIKISDEEAAFAFGGSRDEQSAERLLDLCGASLISLTRGAFGCEVANARASVRLPSLDVDAIDTTGAGDIFGGVLASRLIALGASPSELDEGDLREIAAFATAAAGLSTTRRGGIPSIPSLEDVRETAKKILSSS